MSDFSAAVNVSAADITWELPPLEPEAAQPTDADLTVEALIESQGYRLLAQQLLHQLHEVQLERDLLCGQRLIDRRRASSSMKAAVA